MKVFNGRHCPTCGSNDTTNYFGEIQCDGCGERLGIDPEEAKRIKKQVKEQGRRSKKVGDIRGRELYPEAKGLQTGDVFTVDGIYLQIIGAGYAVRTLNKKQIPETVTIHKL